MLRPAPDASLATAKRHQEQEAWVFPAAIDAIQPAFIAYATRHERSASLCARTGKPFGGANGEFDSLPVANI